VDSLFRMLLLPPFPKNLLALKMTVWRLRLLIGFLVRRAQIYELTLPVSQMKLENRRITFSAGNSMFWAVFVCNANRRDGKV
jgi:hypothetical protein